MKVGVNVAVNSDTGDIGAFAKRRKISDLTLCGWLSTL